MSEELYSAVRQDINSILNKSISFEEKSQEIRQFIEEIFLDDTTDSKSLPMPCHFTTFNP